MIGKTLSQYRITAKLGAGGMGVVYLATDDRLGRKVAIKVLPAHDTSPEQRARFLIEAKAASALNHPGIITIYEAGSDQDIDFIAMEYVTGSTLHGIMASAHQLPFSAALDYALQMAVALSKAHDAGIVHRDLKPANVMVNEDGRVKILDFGLARINNSLVTGDEETAKDVPLTALGMVLGTLSYLSPEQARGETVDARTDVFSFSVMLYEMLAGVRPFTGSSPLAILNSLANDEPKTLSLVCPNIPAAFDGILRRGLAKRREERYASIAEIAADLQSLSDNVSQTGLPKHVPGGLMESALLKIPRYRTSFLGREQEMAHLAGLFDEPRIVTITASGGTGKTRLACEVAAVIAGRFPQGIFMIELADGGPQDVGIRAAESILGDSPLTRVESVTDPVSAIETWLAGRTALLLIDNCEHVTVAVRKLVTRLSRRCPRVSFLNTSREVLGVPGDHVLHLGPLRVTAAGNAVAPAFALFEARASTARDGFKLDSEQSRAVEDICARLDGLPLAIELAASRVRALSPVQIAARLDDALGLLRGRGGEDSDRHRSLEATIRWSYDLLDPGEQSLLARLSVFVGGFDLAAAEAVGSGMPGGDDAVDLIVSLVDKSLVATETDVRSLRYRLPEPIRQFAASRLTESGGAGTAQRAHFLHYLSLAQSVQPKLEAAPDLSVVEALSREHGNFLAAIERTRLAGEFRDTAAMALALNTYWTETGRLGAGTVVLQSIAGANPGDPSMLPLVAALVAYEPMCGLLREAARRVPALEAALVAGLADVVQGRIQFSLGFIDNAAGDSASVMKRWNRAAELVGDADLHLARQILWSASYVASVSGQFDEARVLLDRAAGVNLPIQGWFAPMLQISRSVTGILESGNGVETLRAGLTALESLGLRFRLLLASAAGCLAFFHAGELADAEYWWKRGLETGRDMGHILGCWMLLEYAAWSASVSADYARAARLWGAVDAYSATSGYGRYGIETSRVPNRNKIRSLDPAQYDRCASAGARVPLSSIVDEVLGRPGI